jgi:hypothetical protein
VISVTDWVQAGRYAAVLDPPTPVGGPTTESSFAFGPPAGSPGTPGKKDLTPVQVNVLTAMLLQGQTGTVSVILQAQGNENAVGFTLWFDPATLNYVGANLGSGASGATLNVNAVQAGAGRLGAALALGSGTSFAPGADEVLKVNFRAVASIPGGYSVAFTNLPVHCQVSDTNALAVATSYGSATITVNPLPSIRIARSGTNIALAWPLWATNFGLQQADDARPLAAAWTNLSVSPGVSNGENVVTLPLTGPSKFYRLFKP